MHIPVLQTPILAHLGLHPHGTYVDMTLGVGGHSLGIFNSIESGIVVSFDVDPEAIAAVVAQLDGSTISANGVTRYQQGDKQLILVNRNFAELKLVMQELGIKRVDGIIADLGWSGDQLERVPGLAYSSEASSELDMRLNPTLGVKAKDLLNALYEPELVRIFAEYADIEPRTATKLARAIIAARKTFAIETNRDLLQIIDSTFISATSRGSHAVGKRAAGQLHVVAGERTANLPARVFQALRIAVNNELSILQSALPQAWDMLAAGGTLQFISFHSGEDNIVKRHMSYWVSEMKAENLYANQEMIRPDVEELRDNLRARSAKLRGIRKL